MSVFSSQRAQSSAKGQSRARGPQNALEAREGGAGADKSESRLGCQRSAWGWSLRQPASVGASRRLPIAPRAAERGGARLGSYSFKIAASLTCMRRDILIPRELFRANGNHHLSLTARVVAGPQIAKEEPRWSLSSWPNPVRPSPAPLATP